MKSLKSQLNSAQQHLFGNKRQAVVNGYTIKYSERNGNLYYSIFKGKGTGAQLTSSSNWSEVLKFVHSNYIYRKICCSVTGNPGGAYFYKDTNKMIFSDHPFSKTGFIIIQD